MNPFSIKDLKDYLISKANRYPVECPDGKELQEEADAIKRLGNEALQREDYLLALKLYWRAFMLASQIRDNNKQVATIMSNTAYVMILINNIKEAEDLASACDTLLPDWYKGKYRMMQVAKLKGKPIEVLRLGIILLVSFTLPTYVKEKVIQEMHTAAETKSGDFEEIRTIQRREKHAWTSLLRTLAECGQWHTFYLIMKGVTDDDLMKAQCKANLVQLGQLVKTCSGQEWTEWGEQLAIFLLTKGASFQTLDANKKHPLHVTLSIGIKAGCYGLLEHLFAHYIPTGDRNRLDDDGNTLLHIACSGRYPSQAAAIKLLLENNVDPTVKNKAGLFPLQLLSDDNSCSLQLVNAMEKRGLIVPALNKEKMTKSEDDNAQEQALTESILSSPVYSEAETARGRSKKRASDFASNQWSPGQVKKWMKEHQVDFMISRNLSGNELVELRLMLDLAPRYFYQSLPRLTQVEVEELLKLGDALRILI